MLPKVCNKTLLLLVAVICHKSTGFTPVDPSFATTRKLLVSTTSALRQANTTEAEFPLENVILQGVDDTGRELVLPSETIPTKRKTKGFVRSVFTELDAPYRLHALSATVFTAGGLGLVGCKLLELLQLGTIVAPHAIPYQLSLAVLFLSVIGSIATGTLFLPKGSRFHHYREIFIATDYIMLADLMLWYWMSGGGMLLSSGPVGAALVTAAVCMGVKGDLDFCITDDEGRMEFFRNGYISEEYSKPYWKYFTIIPTHLTTIGLKLAGLAHVWLGGEQWLESNIPAAQFGSALYMSCLLLASWSSFMQGTLTFRQAPFLGKEKFELGNDPTTWFINLVVFIPLVLTAVAGLESGALQEYMTIAPL